MQKQIEFQLSVMEGNTLHNLRKYVQVGFIPQHGMEIYMDNNLFVVRSIPTADLQDLLHVGVTKKSFNKSPKFGPRDIQTRLSNGISLNQYKLLGWRHI